MTECIREGILADFLLSHEEELKKLGAMEREEGIAEGRSQSILLLLSLRGPVPEWLKERILSETNLSVLEDWIRTAGETSSIEGFLEKAGLKDA